MNFWEKIASKFLNDVGIGENTPSNFQFGSLGEFANRIDRSAQRQYIESGMTNIRPRVLDVYMQTPDITIVIKKRLFSSLIENYKVELMDDNDKLFFRATKQLFQNKCRAIAEYEKLTKIEKIGSKDEGILNNMLLPLAFAAMDSLVAVNSTSSFAKSSTRAALETIRKVKVLSDPNYVTTWIDDKTIPYSSDVGNGTGTFELTTVSQMGSTSSVEFGAGSANFTAEDPYKLMVVTEDDIETAIKQASSWAESNFFKVTSFQLDQSIKDLTDRLNEIRLSRKASKILFKVQEHSLLCKKIRASFDLTGLEIIFEFDNLSLGFDAEDSITIAPSATEGVNGLQGDEIKLFKQILNNMYLMLGFKTTSTSDIKEYNKQTNYVRSKMLLHYANRAIIQPMDVIAIFVSSKTMLDSKQSQGFNYNFSSDTFVSKINNLIGSLESTVDDIKTMFSGETGGSNELTIAEVEKNSIVGPEFPNWLWMMLRNEFTRQAAGTCVFYGLVDDVSHGYSNSGGKYTLTVNAKDNSKYLSMGQINKSPSSDVYNGAIMDPLTPFDIDYDISSGMIVGNDPRLLPENQRLLNSGMISAHSGRNRGQKISNKKYFELTEIEQIASKLSGSHLSSGLRKKYINPEGFIYRWKEGIGTLVMMGERYFDGGKFGFESEISPTIYSDPFVGQDVMNGLSLLITGQPYNFNTFMRASLKNNQLSKEAAFNIDGTVSYLKGYLTGIAKQNATWGGFVPYKKLIINERGYNFIINQSFSLVDSNARILQQLNERAEIFDKISVMYKNTTGYKTFANLTQSDALVRDDSAFTNLASRLTTLDEQIQMESDQFNKLLDNNKYQPTANDDSSSSGTITIFGNDISFDPDVCKSNGSDIEENRTKARNELRKRISDFTQRRLWKVKANDDINLFIVDDTYDKNYNIQAFEQSIVDIKLFDSAYTNVYDQINGIAQLLGLEVFANSQGHIEARPPQYNRMPSSVFYNMLQKRAEKGIQIFPKYLETLFLNSVKGQVRQLEILEEHLRLRLTALGFVDDEQRENFLGGNAGQPFKFLSSEYTGYVEDDLNVLFDSVNPDEIEEKYTKSLTALSSKINSYLNNTVNFSITKRLYLLSKITVKPNEKELGYIDYELQKIRQRLKQKTQEDAPELTDLIKLKEATGIRSQTDVLNIFEEISTFVSNRQILMRTLANNLRNLNQGLNVNNSESSAADSLMFPNLYQNNVNEAAPEIMQHMIEDESNDDYGYGAGRRYILTDGKIRNLTITEKSPDFTSVLVNGSLSLGLVKDPDSLNIASAAGQGGNAMTSAFAVDYDMWRMYGFKTTNAYDAKFLSNPQTQCAPFAVYLLNLARKNILRGTVTVNGNEFIQPGEVYYIEDRNLLFYGTSVNHSFSYGGDFTTTINLTYGRSPGEYIPTQLDIIGQGLYQNRYQANLYRQIRTDRVDGYQSAGIIVYDKTKESGSTDEEIIQGLVGGSFGEQNKQTLTNLLALLGGLLNSGSSNERTDLEIRTYKNSKKGFNPSGKLLQIADAIKRWLMNPTSTDITGAVIPDAQDTPVDYDEFLKRISRQEIDYSSDEESRGPSGRAISFSRSLVKLGGGAVSEQQSDTGNEDTLGLQEQERLVECIVDIWLKFTKV